MPEEIIKAKPPYGLFTNLLVSEKVRVPKKLIEILELTEKEELLVLVQKADQQPYVEFQKGDLK